MVDKWSERGEDAQATAWRADENGRAAIHRQPPDGGGKAKGQDLPVRRSAIRARHHPALAKTGDEGRQALIPPHPETRSAHRLWQVWKKLSVASRHQQIPIVGTLLAKSLRQHPDARVYGQIDGFLAETGRSTENKALVIDLLSEIATPEALDILLRHTATGKSAATYFLALLAIARIGDNRWGGGFHEELSPVLESAWVNPESSEPALLTTLAATLAKVGAPEGVDLLLQTLTVNDNSKQKQETGQARQEAAFLAVPQTRNPNAVPVLAEQFRNAYLGTPAFEVSGAALAAIGSPDAIEEIMVWAKQAPDEGARNLEAWLAQIEDDKALQAIAAVPAESFQSLEVQGVVKQFVMGADP